MLLALGGTCLWKKKVSIRRQIDAHGQCTGDKESPKAREQVTKLIDLTEGEHLLDKETLKNKLSFNVKWYQYFQIQHLFTSLNLEHVLMQPLTAFESLIRTSTRCRWMQWLSG